ncbi:MAG: helix-turn-helix domain-containing protein [Candidatus Acidiferrales bacterium]
MSLEASAWAKAQTHHPDGSPLLAREKLLLMVLADYHNAHSRFAWVGLARLSQETLSSRRQIMRLVQQFESKGGLLRAERAIAITKGDSGKQRAPNRYILGLDAVSRTLAGSDMVSPPPSDTTTPPVVTPSHQVVTNDAGGSDKNPGFEGAYHIEPKATGNTKSNTPCSPPPERGTPREPNKFRMHCNGGDVFVYVPLGRRLWRKGEQERFARSCGVEGQADFYGYDPDAVMYWFKAKGFRVEFTNLFEQKETA